MKITFASNGFTKITETFAKICKTRQKVCISVVVNITSFVLIIIRYNYNQFRRAVLAAKKKKESNAKAQKIVEEFIDGTNDESYFLTQVYSFRYSFLYSNYSTNTHPLLLLSYDG